MSGQIHKATHTVGVRRAGSLTKRFLTFIDEDDFPCVGAKAALSRGALRTADCGLRSSARWGTRRMIGACSRC